MLTFLRPHCLSRGGMGKGYGGMGMGMGGALWARVKEIWDFTRELMSKHRGMSHECRVH
jgi:hypothetical protein